MPAAYASDLNGLVADVGDRPKGARPNVLTNVTDLKARAPATRAWLGLEDAHTLADEAHTLADATACAASVPATRAWRGLEDDRGAGVGWGREGGDGGGGGEGDWDGEEYSAPEHVHTSAFRTSSAQPAAPAGCVVSAAKVIPADMTGQRTSRINTHPTRAQPGAPLVNSAFIAPQ